MNKKNVEQVEEIINGTATSDELVEIERIVREAKDKITPETSLGFWEGKIPCWEMCSCPESLHKDCPGFKYRTVPCWEIEGTYCKLDDYGINGRDISICQVCRVYKQWGDNQPIKIKLFGKGCNPSLPRRTG